MLTTIKTELRSFEDLAQSFAAKELVANRTTNDRYPFGTFFDSVVSKANEVGLFGITAPEACGGSGQGIDALCVILDHISAADASLAGILFTNALAQEIMILAGAHDALKDVIGKAGDAQSALIACPAFCNPDETATRLEAVRNNGAYRLSGTADYVVLGGLAGHVLVPARIQGQNGYAYFLIKKGVRGMSTGDPIFSLGLHACPAVDLRLESAEAVLIGAGGAGSRHFNAASDRLHAAVAAIQCGIMKGAFQEALSYSQERFQGGWTIINWSALRMLLADMAVQVKIADMAVAGAAIAAQQHHPQWELSTRAAALHLSDLACTLTTDGIQVLGGNGYMKDYGQEKRFRDAKQVQALLGLSPMRKLNMVRALMQG